MDSPTHTRPNMKKHSGPGPDPLAYETEIYQKGLTYSRPPFTFTALDWEPLAAERMSAESKGYVTGNAGSGETARKNRLAFEKWSILPRRLVDTQKHFPDLSISIFGQDLPFPIALAPVGVQRIFNPDGEIASAKAAAKERVPYIMSTASSASIEEVARANGPDGDRWFQLYWPANEHDDITISILSRAKKAGFSVLVVTLDTFILGWRPSDMNNGYNPFLRSDQVGVAIGFTDPVFRKQFRETHGVEVEDEQGAAAAEWTRTVFPGFSHNWEDVKFLQRHWDGPIVLKGIQTVADAKKCVEIGVQGIVVSNHGGRQTDGGVSSLGVLPRIVDAVGAHLEVIFDSGIRCGADIAKAMALGAKMCLVGRPYVYGLVLGGEAGVSHVVKSLLGDLDLTLHLAGIPSVSPKVLNRDVLIREADL
ncbi:L-lactate dehydrogenase (cytochrome) [Capronia coronata CBS 617.96]|uniref:L-lactate dehydrogenase (Cytochrome) n=1 Tax=Capronia coronata CBS 617.96 TaxID=1182541 RepID=W9YMW2_9EURO|nr:L-lactate dehydrogenase (cytochrome) [Capronia coronata CBS 617.96]EXJ83609.1 L-lactate dehydrogenase (cytochrome) [Capronia coronata CBS 617.96]